MTNTSGKTKRPTYCYQCVAGPDLLNVTVEDGVATEVEPNFKAADIHPGAGKVCVKAYGLVQKTYNPHRIKTPMKRTNPKKGRKEDPGFVSISWDEALDTIAAKMKDIKATGLLDESGYPRVAASFGGGGTPQHYMGTFPAFLAAWGPIDFGMGSGQGVKCYHSEHLYGEYWHKAFTVSPDTPLTKYLVSFGANPEAGAGVCGVARHAQARIDGIKRVQVEPALSVTGACSAEWVPIKPKTDPAFMFAMIHVILHEHEENELDVPFLKNHTASPYLVGPNGYFMRNARTRKPLMWDLKTGRTVAHDAKNADPALGGEYDVAGVEEGPDGQVWSHKKCKARPAHAMLCEHVKSYTPEWAAEICEVPAETIRNVGNDFLAHACIGETIEIDGEEFPHRPVAISLGKTVTNGWGGYECCWARTLLAVLVGGLEVPGGTIGTTVRLNGLTNDRLDSVKPGKDGFMSYPMNATDKENWQSRPNIRNAYQTLVPLSANTAWSQALGPTHLAWLFQDKAPENLPKPTQPDLWFVYRTNPAISAWDAPGMVKRISKFPFVVAFAYTDDETNHAADILLPECTDLESTQLTRVGGTSFIEAFWKYEGFAIRQPMVEPQHESRDFTDIVTDLAERVGMLGEYNTRINKGNAGVRLFGEGYDFSLDVEKKNSCEEIWDAVCRAASAELTGGKESDGLDWFKKEGYKVRPYQQSHWYLYNRVIENNLRFELPYQENLFRIGQQLKNRLHEHGIEWWDTQLSEYQCLPKWKDFPALWSDDDAEIDGQDGRKFWLLTSRSMQYAWGGNVAIPMIKEVANNVAGHTGIIMNRGTAEEMGLNDGDRVEIRSSLRSTQGRIVLRQGIRPDTLLMIGQFDHWKTPVAKDFDMPSMNTVTPLSMKLTDATGSSSDTVRVTVTKVGDAA